MQFSIESQNAHFMMLFSYSSQEWELIQMFIFYSLAKKMDMFEFKLPFLLQRLKLQVKLKDV